MKIYLFRGKSASGKTTLTNALSRKMNIPVLRKDDIFDAVSAHVDNRNILNSVSYDTLAKMIQTCVDNNSDVIVDMALPDITSFEMFMSKIDLNNAEVYRFFCDCSNEELWRKRLEKRLEKPEPNQYFKSVEEIKKHYNSLDIRPMEEETVLDSAQSFGRVLRKADEAINKRNKALPSFFEILWKVVLIIFASIGVYLQARDDGGLFRNHTYLYFTIISNMGTAIVFFMFFIAEIFERSRGRAGIPKQLFILKYMFTAAMAVTLIVSSCLLAPFKDNAYLFSMKNLSLHIFAPLITVIDFLAFDNRIEYRKRTVFLGFVLPLMYLTVTLLLSIRGISYSNGTNYPYYFLDYRTLGWFTHSGGNIGVFWWILIVAVITLAVSAILTFLKRIILWMIKK